MKNFSLSLCLSLLLLHFAVGHKKPHLVLPERCILLADPGPCKDQEVLVYAYDMYSNLCKSFLYGNCGGNPNRFATMAECRKRCEIKENKQDDETRKKIPDDYHDQDMREEL